MHLSINCGVSLCLQSKDKTILYAVACTLINCTNSYDKKEIIPELVQLAKFSKQHVPEQHPKVKDNTTEPPDQTKKKKKLTLRVHKLVTDSLFSQDKKDFIEQRVKRLLKAGVTSALAVMVKADNSILTDQTKEMLAR